MNPEEADRDRLSAMQVQFLQALTSNGAVPPGFDADRVRVTSQSLVSKRMRSIGRAWPALMASLGDAFPARFAEFAATTPLPAQGGPLADGWAFARGVMKAGMSDAARVEILAVDLRYRVVDQNGSLIQRRSLYLRVARLRRARQLVLALRVPWLGEYWARLPWF